MAQAVRTNKYGVKYAKGEVFGMADKWIANCEAHNTIVSDTTLAGIRTMSQQDFCDCCRNICLENLLGADCGNCGAVVVAVR
jgi:hypothetical protein